MTYVALLRGINVGGNAKVDMKKLKESFEKLGFKNVSTYINSGNVIFEDGGNRPAHTIETIENGILSDFGLTIRVVIRSKAEIKKICEITPDNWENDSTTQKTDVLFLWDEVDSSQAINEIVTNPDVDHLLYTQGAIIWHIDRTLYNKSGMHKFIGTKIYKNMTARNINTVRKLLNLMIK